MMVSWLASDHRTASSWLKRRPRADITTTGPCNSPSESTASRMGSALSTIPAPPPNGVSSTVRCLSCVKSRNCTIRYDTLPASAALPGIDAERNGVITSGNSVTTFTASIAASVQQAIGDGHREPPPVAVGLPDVLPAKRQQELPLLALHL